MILRPALRIAALLSLSGMAAQALAQKPEPPRADINYTVQRGDTVSAIARDNLIDGERQDAHQRLAAHNNLRDPNKVLPGTVLRIPAAWLRREAAGAIVLSVTGEVQMNGQALKPGDQVPEGAQLTSGAGSNARIEFADRSVVTLKSGTALRIEAHKRNPKLSEFETRLRLGAGEVEAVVTKQRAPNFRIYAPTGNIAVRGTNYRVRGGDAVNMFEILEGNIDVSGAVGGTVPVGAGFGTVVRRGERPIPPVQLLEAPDISSIATLQETTTVRLTVPPLPGATSYLFRAATDAEFREIVIETVQRRPEVRIVDLRDAEYFYGIRGIDPNGLQGQEALGRFRLVRPPLPMPPPMPAEPAAPAPGTVAPGPPPAATQ